MRPPRPPPSGDDGNGPQCELLPGGLDTKNTDDDRVGQDDLADEPVTIAAINAAISAANWPITRVLDEIDDANRAIDRVNDLIRCFKKEHPSAWGLDEIDEIRLEVLDPLIAEIDEGDFEGDYEGDYEADEDDEDEEASPS
jgi:hypothetical protein